MTEEWRDVQVYRNGKLIKLDGYQVERYTQQVKSFKIYEEGRILKPHLDTYGYPSLTLQYNKRNIVCSLHRIMVDTFTPENPLNLPHINHKNGVKTDYRLENLERCTASYNEKHSFEILGKKPQHGEDNGSSKLTEVQVKEIIKLLEEDKLTERQIADRYDVTQGVISSIKLGKAWKCIDRPIFEKKRLTEAQVIKIYNDAWFSSLTPKEIGEKYDISESNVSVIKNGINWNHITQHKRTKPIGWKNSKHVKEEVLAIYNDAWHSSLKLKEIAKKHNVSITKVANIKLGYEWSKVTGHVKGCKPSRDKQITEATEDVTYLDYWL